MKYEKLYNIYPEDKLHLKALMSARGVTNEDIVDASFIEVLEDEFYDLSLLPKEMKV